MQKMISHFSLFLILWAVLPLTMFAENPQPGLELGLHWEEYTLPATGDNAAQVIGMHRGIIFAAGANSDNRSIPLYFMRLDEGTRSWKTAKFFIEGSFGVITPIPTMEGVIFIGKSGSSKGYDRLGLLSWDDTNGSPQWRELERLPTPLSEPALGIYDGKLIICGKAISNNKSIRFYQRPIHDEEVKWLELPELITREALSGANVFIQSDGESDAVYLFGSRGDGARNSTVGFFMNSLKGKWDPINLPLYLAEVNGGITLGNAHIVLFTGEQPAAYHTITNTWIGVEDFSPVFQPYCASKDQERFYIWSSDKLGSRFYVGERISRFGSIKPLDYVVLIAYFVAVLTIGHVFSRRQKGTDDYFRAGKRIPSWAAGFSILVTKLSAITFVSLPAKAFATNWLYFWIPVGNVLLAIIVIKFILPFFYRMNITTTYEYLEKRFNTSTRVIGSATYVVFEIVRMGVLLLLPAIVITVITGIDIYLCIVIIGVVVTLYTMMGGIEAVIWTDVLQTVVLISGCIAALIIVGIEIDPKRVNDFLHSAVGQQKMKLTDFSMDFSQATILVIGLSWIGKLQDYVSNQAVVQRFISTKNEKSAARSIWVASLMGIPVIAMFLLLGTGLFLFYEAHPGRLDPFMEKPDALLATFILREMPTGICGLVLAAIFAAAMANDSSLNSMSTVITTDFYKRFGPHVTEAKSFKLAKILTVFLGALGTASALFMAGNNIPSLYDQVFSVIGLFGGGLAGVFILGIFTKRANSAGTLTGFFASAILLYGVSNYSDLHVLLYAVIGMGSCVVIGYLASVVMPSKQDHRPGYTIYDYTEKHRSAQPLKEVNV